VCITDKEQADAGLLLLPLFLSLTVLLPLTLLRRGLRAFAFGSQLPQQVAVFFLEKEGAGVSFIFLEFWV
jgi:hypothetical protein